MPALHPLLGELFDGKKYRLADNWFDHLNVEYFKYKPIVYLEIGTFYGANVISVAKTYGAHPESRLYCVDPWEDYSDYTEYEGQQNGIYSTFMRNMETSGIRDKVTICRGYSHTEVVKFPDNMFDMIYIDGNHEPEYVLEDAVVCFRKLKQGGIMIFDDYGWGGPDMTQRGIDAFLSGYHKRVRKLGEKESQVFVEKL